jgi:hypothetical protein
VPPGPPFRAPARAWGQAGATAPCLRRQASLEVASPIPLDGCVTRGKFQQTSPVVTNFMKEEEEADDQGSLFLERPTRPL